MNLQETVSLILGKQVSIEDAKDFAHNQFGTLAAHIRNNSEKPTYKYIEIVDDDTKEVVKRLGVSKGNEKNIEKLKRALIKFLDSPKYSVRTTVSNTELEFVSK